MVTVGLRSTHQRLNDSLKSVHEILILCFWGVTFLDGSPSHTLTTLIFSLKFIYQFLGSRLADFSAPKLP